MSKDVLCNTCTLYVKCRDNDSSFCLAEDLYTHTERTSCINYSKGEPTTEEEYDTWGEKTNE